MKGTLLGDYTPDGSVGPTLFATQPRGDMHASNLVDRVPAVEVDGFIYPPGGDGMWVLSLAEVVVGALGIGAWGVYVVRRRARRRLSAAPR